MANHALAGISNAALITAIMIYGLAMVAYAFDFAFTRRQVTAGAPAVAPAKVATTALVSVGAGADGTDHTFGADPADVSQLADLNSAASTGGGSTGAVGQTRWPSGAWLRLAFALTCVGLVVHIGAITTRGIAEDRVPWGNMYEFISAITCAAVLILTLAAVKFRAYYMGLFVLLPVVIALVVDVVVIYTPAGEEYQRSSPTGSPSTSPR